MNLKYSSEMSVSVHRTNGLGLHYSSPPEHLVRYG